MEVRRVDHPLVVLKERLRDIRQRRVVTIVLIMLAVTWGIVWLLGFLQFLFSCVFLIGPGRDL